YNQARLFFESQSPAEQAHIAAAFRFELSKVTVPAIRERMLSSLRNASEELAAKVADGLNMPLPPAMPLAIENPPEPEVRKSPSLSLLARPGDGSIAGRKVVILVADGVDGKSAKAVHAALFAQGAVPRFAAPRIGPVKTVDGVPLEADLSLENEPGFLFDALVVSDGQAAIDVLARDAHVYEFIRDQFRHCKPMLALGAGVGLLRAAGLGPAIDDPKTPTPGLIIESDAAAGAKALIAGLGTHRPFERETDPPKV
ncbi:MAG: catalase HPII, partial [Rubrivivax sp.]